MSDLPDPPVAGTGPGRKRRRPAERVSIGAFVVSLVGSVTMFVTYWRGGQPQIEGLGLLGSLGGLGVALVVWGRHLLDPGEATQERERLGSEPEERDQFEESLARDQPILRRTALRRMLAASMGAFGAALLFPIRSLGPSPGTSLTRTPWRAGKRLVDENGRLIRATDVPLDGLVTAFPEGSPGSAQGQIALVRVEEALIRSRKGRAGWHPHGLLAYSKVCTHAGCPVSLYLAESHQLLCPCHQSSFDALDGAKPVQGPAARPLAQLPLRVDADGFIRATGGFSEAIGPAWWDRP